MQLILTLLITILYLLAYYDYEVRATVCKIHCAHTSSLLCFNNFHLEPCIYLETSPATNYTLDVHGVWTLNDTVMAICTNGTWTNRAITTTTEKNLCYQIGSPAWCYNKNTTFEMTPATTYPKSTTFEMILVTTNTKGENFLIYIIASSTLAGVSVAIMVATCIVITLVTIYIRKLPKVLHCTVKY